ncbi:uncharacterized protein RAG0_15484 [Rhynchosporium agropyri]|uniref:Uncharacterized protein n=1 Tax=Rhynchosporium agropyri TaxID=914238 RepID=A0A1E1LLC9_9HELO|nr:uncharacterized protein RAG0_15484 [Rhynchosporium agropyri]
MCSIHLSIDTFPEQCIISSLVIQGISTQTLEIWRYTEYYSPNTIAKNLLLKPYSPAR